MQQVREREGIVAAAQGECVQAVTAAIQMATETAVLRTETKQIVHDIAEKRADPWGTDHGGNGTDLGVVSQKFCGDSLGHHHGDTNITYPDQITIAPM